MEVKVVPVLGAGVTAGGAPDTSEPLKASTALEMERKPLGWRRSSPLSSRCLLMWPESCIAFGHLPHVLTLLGSMDNFDCGD